MPLLLLLFNEAKQVICIANYGKAKKKCTVSQKKMTNLIILFVLWDFLCWGDK